MNLKRPAALTFLAPILLWSSLLFSQTPQTDPQGLPEAKSTISGTVVRATTGEPIPRATLTLTHLTAPNAGQRGGGPQGQGQRGQADQPQTVTATTDDQGKFRLAEIETGAYRLVAARNGFVRQEYGQHSVNGPGTVMNITAGQQLTDIAFRLMPAATISGRVLDSNGEPLPGITVQALRSTYDASGKRTLQPAASARTNDLGEYRLYWINPGRYFVNATSARSALEIITSRGEFGVDVTAGRPSQTAPGVQAAGLFGPAPNPNEVIDSSFGLTYFPGTPDPSRALVLDLQPGREIRAVDFTLARTERVSLRGRVIDAQTGQPPQNATVSISPRDSSAPSSPLDALLGIDPLGNRYNRATGEFMVQNVTPGSYWLQVIAPGAGARAPGTPQNGNPTAAEAFAALSNINTARIPIEVLGSDINNLTLTVSSGIAIPGRLRIDGNAPNQNISAFTLALQPTSGPPNILTMLQGAGVRAAADGSFSIPRITPGDYRLAVNGLGTGFYIKEARLNQTDVLQGGLSVSDTFRGTLEVTLGTNPGQITGVVTDATFNPAGGVQTVLIPERLRNRLDLYIRAVTDQEGRFTIRGVMPGDYRLFAWEDIEPFSYFDPAVLSEYEQQGTLVHIGEGSSETVPLRLIPAN